MPRVAASSGHLERDGAVVLQVLGEEDGRHAAAAELALDGVAVGQSRREVAAQIATHFVPSTSRWNFGFERSGSKVGSIRSQPAERK